MSETLTVRNLSAETHTRLLTVAAENHRSVEAHVRFLIEQETEVAAETCGELLDALEAAPPPAVEVAEIDGYLADRGRRSPRP